MMRSQIHPPLAIFGPHVQVVMQNIKGAGGLGGVDAKVLKDWCTCFSSELEHFQVTVGASLMVRVPR